MLLETSRNTVTHCNRQHRNVETMFHRHILWYECARSLLNPVGSGGWDEGSAGRERVQEGGGGKEDEAVGGAEEKQFSQFS